jgi:hypothetical protein
VRQRLFLLAAAGLTLAMTVPGLGSAGPAFNNKFEASPRTHECRDSNDNVVGTITYDAPLKMWPPNHKYQATTFLAQATDPEDSVELATQGTHEEYAEDGSELNGAGNTGDDVSPAAAEDGPNTGSATTSHEIRSERAGTGDGRVYALSYEAVFVDNNGEDGYGTVACEDSFTVEVPHDMRGGAAWKKQ